MFRSVSGLFSNPPGVELLPVMLRRLPRRKRSANRLCNFLPVVISVVTLFFPLSGSAAGPAVVSGSYSGRDGSSYEGWVSALGLTVASAAEARQFGLAGISVRCVRAREEQAVPLFG